MDIQNLKDFVMLAHYRNFSSAADASNISQSALSKQIRNLEYEIGGVKLVDRAKRPLELTDAGKEFLKRANVLLSAYGEMLESMKAFQKDASQPFRIGVYPALSSSGLMAVVESFMEKSAGEMTFEVIDRQSAELRRMLLDGTLDAAFLTTAPKHGTFQNLSLRKLKQFQLFLAVNRNNPLSARKTVAFRALAEQNILLVDSSEAIYSICVEKCNAEGISPTISTFRYVDTMIDMISANKGVGFISFERSKQNRSKDIVYIPFEENLYFNVSVACHKNALADRRVRDFMNFVEAEQKKLDQPQEK